MKYAVKVKYETLWRSNWEVEAPDEATATKMISDAFTEGPDFEENANCHRAEPDYETGERFEEIESITEIKKAEAERNDNA